jgi:hypothetical protein
MLPHYIAAHRRHADAMTWSDPQTARRERKQVVKHYQQRAARRERKAA